MEAQTKETTHILHYVAYSGLSIALGVLGYFYYAEHNKILPQPQTTIIKAESFSDLPIHIQSDYVTKAAYVDLEKKADATFASKQKVEEELVQLKEKLQQTEQENKQVVHEVSEEKSVVLKPEISIEVAAMNSIQEDKHLVKAKEFAKCYDMEIGSYSITKSCRKHILTFIDEHKNAQYFEIIGLVDETEFTLYKKLETNNFIYDRLGVNQHAIDNMKKFTQFGLAKYRSMEANWVIKAHTKRKAHVYNATYNLISKDGKRGVIIRAYE